MYTRYEITNCDPNGDGELDDPECSVGPPGSGGERRQTSRRSGSIRRLENSGFYSTPCDQPGTTCMIPKCFYQRLSSSRFARSQTRSGVPFRQIVTISRGTRTRCGRSGARLGSTRPPASMPSLFATGSVDGDTGTFRPTSEIPTSTERHLSAEGPLLPEQGSAAAWGGRPAVNLRGAVRTESPSRRVAGDGGARPGAVRSPRPRRASARDRGAGGGEGGRGIVAAPAIIGSDSSSQQWKRDLHWPAVAAPGQLPPSIRLKLTPGPGQRLGFGLEISNVAIPMAPAACPAATIVSQSTSPFPLTLKVSLREPGGRPQTISVSSLFTCQPCPDWCYSRADRGSSLNAQSSDPVCQSWSRILAA